MSDDQTPTPTPRYRRVLEASAELARASGHSHVGVEHLFLAIILDRKAVPTQVLARITDLDGVEASLREVMASDAYAGKPPEGAVWFPLSELPDLLSALPSCVPPGVEYGFNVVRDRAWIIVHEPGNTAEVVAMARAQIEQK
jgi:ATP-dependent Clp protease ATP-binding subunit ClpC